MPSPRLWYSGDFRLFVGVLKQYKTIMMILCCHFAIKRYILRTWLLYARFPLSVSDLRVNSLENLMEKVPKSDVKTTPPGS